MDIDAQDCRLDGTSDGQATFWWRATHLPTGVVVEADRIGGELSKRVLMIKLQAAVSARRDVQ